MTWQLFYNNLSLFGQLDTQVPGWRSDFWAENSSMFSNSHKQIIRSGDLVLLIVLMVSFDWLLNPSGKCIFVDFTRDVDCPLHVTRYETSLLSLWNHQKPILSIQQHSQWFQNHWDFEFSGNFQFKWKLPKVINVSSCRTTLGLNFYWLVAFDT